MIFRYIHITYTLFSIRHMYSLMYNHNRYKYINIHASSMSYEYIYTNILVCTIIVGTYMYIYRYI